MSRLLRWLATPQAVVLIIAIAVAIRALAVIAMPAPLESDARAYFTMAQTLSAGLTMRDHFGLMAYYSPGYPLLLAIPFALFGASVGLALAINVALGGLSCWLACRIGTRIGGAATGAIAGLAFALWLPGIFGATFVHKENLTAPLLMGFVLAVLAMKDARRPQSFAVVAGLLYGAGLLAGASSLLIAVAALWAVFRLASHQRAALLSFAGGALICLMPWLAHTNALFAKPVLTTNSGFNLYLGNNPAATGRFVSMADTPMGSQWHRLLAEKGEAGAAAALAAEARNWIADHPASAAALSARKLALFWLPNWPSTAELTADPVIGLARLIDVAQHLMIIILGLIGLWQLRAGHDARLVALTIGAFWAIHALTYIITRYRDPVMPLMIVLAAVPVARWLTTRKAMA